MSAIEDAIDGALESLFGEGIEGLGTGRGTECRPPARVFIGGTEVPVVGDGDGNGGLNVQMRKTGASDLTTTARFTVPYVWNDEDIIGSIGSIEEIAAPPVRVAVKDAATDQYVTVHNGPIATLGPSQSFNGGLRIRVNDYANVLGEVSANVQFTDRFTVKDVLEYVSSRAQEHELLAALPFTVKTDNRAFGFDEDVVGFVNERVRGPVIATDGDDSTLRRVVEASYNSLFKNVDTNKSFTPNKHTLVDVMDWLCGLLNAQWFVRDGTLIIADKPTARSLTGVPLDETPSAGDLRLIENNALFQISPMNALTVNGATREKLSEDSSAVEFSNAPFSGDQSREYVTVYPSATVVHTELAERAGKNNAPPVVTSDAKSLDEVEQQAKSELKSRLDGASGGEMVALPAGSAFPYNTVTAQPVTCGSNVALNDVTYEVEEVIHEITPPSVGGEGGARTVLRCGIEVTPEEDFEVTSEFRNAE